MDKPAPDLAFMTCIERGPLEAEALLLYASLRRFGGAFANLPIYAVTPRPGHSISDATRRILADLQVEYLELPLNLDFPEEGFYNKAVATAYLEQHTSHELLAWLDDDMLFLRQPDLFAIPPAMDIAIIPSFFKDMATGGPGDPRDIPWRVLYQHFQVPYQNAPYVTTRAGNQRVRFYYNSGLFIVRRTAGILSLYHQIMTEMLYQVSNPFIQSFRYPHNQRMGDQPALALAVWKKTTRVQILPAEYNCLLVENAQISNFYKPDLQQAVLAHYMHTLSSSSVIRHWMFQLDSGLSTDMRAWLIPFLPLDKEQLTPAEVMRIQDQLQAGAIQ